MINDFDTLYRHLQGRLRSLQLEAKSHPTQYTLAEAWVVKEAAVGLSYLEPMGLDDLSDELHDEAARLVETLEEELA